MEPLVAAQTDDVVTNELTSIATTMSSVSTTLLRFYTQSDSAVPWQILDLNRSLFNFAGQSLNNPSMLGATSGGAVASLLSLLNPGTPGSDILLGNPIENNILWGRTGDDTILGVNPGDAEPGAGKIDVMLGDSVPGGAPGRDLFILGDENNAYYASQGFSDFAVITDFQTSLDTIRLHGTASTYRLIPFNSVSSSFQNGTAIFLNKPLVGYPNIEVPELVSIVFADAPLSVNSSYFDFDNAPPSNDWINPQARQLGTSGIDSSFGTAADNNGNAYLVGTTTGSLGGVNQGSYDVWIAKYDSHGNRIWIDQIGTPQQDNLTRVTTDSADNVLVAGFTLGNLAGTNAGLEDAFLAKYDPNGNQIWARQYGTSQLDNIFDVTTDLSNNVFVTGFTIGDLGGPNASPIPITDDSYIAKFDSDGNQQWLRQFGTTVFDEAYGVTTDSAGNVYATGWTQGDLGGPNAGLYDIWVVKYSGAGDPIWKRQFGTPQYEFAWDIGTDANDNIYLTGWTLGKLGDTQLGSYDAWIAKYDSDGNQAWVKQFGTTEDDVALGLDVTSSGVFVSGFTSGNFAGVNAGSDDAWYAKFDFDGNLVSAKQIGTPDQDRARGGIAVNESGKIFVSGITDGSLGGVNAGSYDAWLFTDQDTQDINPQPSLVATPDHVITAINTPVAINVLANDSGFDDHFTLTLVDLPSQGTAQVQDNGTPANSIDDFILYTPERNATGNFTFTYQIDNGKGDSSTAVVDVSVALPPDQQQETPGLIDLTKVDLDGDGQVDTKVNLVFSNTSSEALYNNMVGFYAVENKDGSISDLVTGNSLRPTDEGYAMTALQQRLSGVEFDRNAGAFTIEIAGGILLAPFLVANGTPEEFLAQNASNQQWYSPNAYFAYLGANPDQVTHVQSLGDGMIGFEDLWGGGDQDFNDFVFQTTLTKVG